MARRFVLIVVGVAFIGGAAWLLTRPAPTKPATPAPAAPAAAPKLEPTPSAPVERIPEPTKPKSAAPKPAKGETPAPVAVEAPPTTGTLRVTADVPEASVFIDRKYVGTAPVTASDVAPGPHHLNVSAPGYDAVSMDMDVTPGPRDINIKLKEVRLNASLAVTHKHAMGSCAGSLRATRR